MNIIYVKPDGTIIKKLIGARHIPELDGCTAVVIAEPCNIRTSYYSGGQIHAKQPMALEYPATAEVEQVVSITGIPENADVYWPDREHTVESGELSFDANAQGEYRFTITHAQYLTERIIINVS